MLFNEPKLLKFLNISSLPSFSTYFSALQRAEIAEIQNEQRDALKARRDFSALQRAEIAEIVILALVNSNVAEFQCSSTSRNC